MRILVWACAALMVVLMLSMPLLSLAERTPIADIIAIAERDADKDISKILWFGEGMCLSCVGASYFTFSANPTIALAATVLTPIVGLGAIYSHQPGPPVERLIGKSPEYVSTYTDAYKSKARSLRTKSAAFGAVTGCGVLTGVTIVGCLLGLRWFAEDFASDGLYGQFVF